MIAERPIRQPLRYRDRRGRRRKLDERLWARFPALIRVTTGAVLRLPHRSRLRRLMVAYWAQRSYEIVNRRDFELALAAQDPNVLISYAPDPAGRMPPDLIGEYRGEEGFRHAWEAWLDAFEDLRLEPKEVTDLGDDRLLIALRAIGRGTASGAPTEQEGFVINTFRRGLVVEHRWFFDRSQAETAAGLDQSQRS